MLQQIPYADAGRVQVAPENSIGSAVRSVLCDTTIPFTVKHGSAYCFKITVLNGSPETPSFTVGNGSVLKTQFVAKEGTTIITEFGQSVCQAKALAFIHRCPTKRPKDNA